MTGIERRFSEWPIDLPGASVLSLILVALAMLAFVWQRRVLKGRGYETTTGKPARGETLPLGNWRWPIAALFAVIVAVATFAPLFAIAATAFSRTLSGGLAIDNLSLAHFQAIAAGGSEASGALATSLLLGLGAAIVTGLTGVLVAYCVVKTRTRGRVVLDALAVLPNTMPGVVVGVGLILAWNQAFWPATPYNTWGILLLAYCCLLLPYPVRYSHAALMQIGDNLKPRPGSTAPAPSRRWRASCCRCWHPAWLPPCCWCSRWPRANWWPRCCSRPRVCRPCRCSSGANSSRARWGRAWR